MAPDIRIGPLLPVLIVAATAMVVLLRGAFAGADQRPRPVDVALLGLGLAAVASLRGALGGGEAFGRMLVLDQLAAFLSIVLLLGTAAAIQLASEHLTAEGVERSESYALFLLSACGMLLMASAGSLVTLFLGLETMSIALYVLAGLAGARDERSNEAALKYLLLGAFATGFLIYGMAFVYGSTGTLDLHEIAGMVAADAHVAGFMAVGLALLGIGLGFKVALVPFHMWAPDVYEGSPTPVTAFMAVGPKVAGYAALIRVFDGAALGAREQWLTAFWLLCAATMLVGNVVALAQTNVKRMLAYSSIAHAGYLLLGVLAGTQAGVQGVLYYALAYTVMTAGAFAVLAVVAGKDDDRTFLDDFRGLSERAPTLALAMAVCLFSLSGLPPFAGFLGKWLVFAAAVQAGLVPLVVIGVLCSVIGAFYYLRIVLLMYMAEPVEGAPKVEAGPRSLQVVVTAAVLTLVIVVPLVAWIAGQAAGAIF